MPAASGDAKVTSLQLQALVAIDENTPVRLTQFQVQALVNLVENTPIRLTQVQVQTLVGMVIFETADFSLGSNLEQVPTVYKFETVDFYAATAYGDAYVRGNFDITFRFSMQDNAEVTNWIRSVQPWEDDWTPEDPII